MTRRLLVEAAGGAVFVCAAKRAEAAKKSRPSNNDCAGRSERKHRGLAAVARIIDTLFTETRVVCKLKFNRHVGKGLSLIRLSILVKALGKSQWKRTQKAGPARSAPNLRST